MKSSIMTMSCCRSSFGPGATSPVLIRTDAMRASSNLMPKKDRLPLPGDGRNETGENESCRSCRSTGCACCLVRRASSNAIWLVNICEHRAETSYCCRAVPLVPGMEKDASVMLLPTGVNNRDRLKALKILAVGGIAKEHGQAALGPARRRSL